MPHARQPRPLVPRAATLAIALTWTATLAVALVFVPPESRLVVVLPVLIAVALTVGLRTRDDARRWSRPLHLLAQRLAAHAENPRQPLELPGAPELTELTRALRDWKLALDCLPTRAFAVAAPGRPQEGNLTRSDLLAATAVSTATTVDAQSSGEFYNADMVCRLEPKSFRWRNASPATLDFFGGNLAALHAHSFLESVHPDDRLRTHDGLRAAVIKGEVHDLVIRIKTARGELKVIEMNVSARYGVDHAVTHLRCHLTDVTSKVRAERDLRLRTRELTQLNEQLRRINRELEDLKDRYRDLYQNAPAMYFSLDGEGLIIECNDTMLQTLGYGPDALRGQPYERVLAPTRRARFAESYAEFLTRGAIEIESQWVKATGAVIDVWVSAVAVIGHNGKLLHTRSVAQDVTAHHRLEAELKEKNDRLARANVELWRKNKEMDEFTYVVSHDLQEPLRTLIAFSDFLLRDYGDQLNDTGQDYVRYLVDASRRMRALIHGLLTLSRAGRVTGDFGPVNLEEVVDVVKADLGELVRARQGTIQVSGPLPTLWGDRVRIGQLLVNLIGNGLKYNRSVGPRVEVGTVPDDSESWATLTVRDNGIGIDPQFHEKIFQLFRRLHTPEEFEGTGAGLAICNKIVQAHGGRIRVESELNHGATFFVRLPSAPMSVAELPVENSYAI